MLKSRVFITVCPGQTKGESEEAGETGDSGEYNVYSTFQSHEPDFDYLKSVEIEEKINKIRWLPQQNAAHFLLSTNGETSATPQFLSADHNDDNEVHYIVFAIKYLLFFFIWHI